MAGIDNNTLLYLRGDSFEDLSLNPKSIVNHGATLDTNSNVIDLNNGGVSTPYTSDFKLQEFTYEGWFKVNNGSAFLFCIGGQSGYYFGDVEVRVDDNGELLATFSNLNNSQGAQSKNPSFKSDNMNTPNVWMYLAMVYKNKSMNIFINGKKVLTYENITLNYRGSSYFVSIGYRLSETVIKCKGYCKNIRISNVARYTEDFTPPTQSFNSITINKTNQTDTNIEFNIEKLGQETINKVEVLVNGIVSETYTDNYDNINYLIDTELCVIGNNDITIRVTYDDTYTEELLLSYFYKPNPLPLETTLLDTVERVKVLSTLKQNEKDMLSSILTSKNVEVSEQDKMSDLIGKVDLLEPIKPLIYGIDIDETNSNPSTCVTYTDDAIGFSPLFCGDGTLDYGSWKDTFIIQGNKPCVLKDGVVQYYLNPNDYSKKENGEASDITSGNDGDVMAEFKKCYYKLWKDGNIVKFRVSPVKVDDSWCCNAFLSEDGNAIEKDYMYISTYESYSSSSKMRSLSGKSPWTSHTIATARTQATANGSGYQQLTLSKWVFITMLTTLVTKSLDHQTKIGQGRSKSSNTSKINTGTMNTKGQFWGDQTATNGMKVFHIENFYGNLWTLMDGLIVSSRVSKYKVSGPYNDSGSGYTSGYSVPTSNGYISKINCSNNNGIIPSASGGSATTYYTDYIYQNSGTYISFIGGGWDDGSSVGSFYLNVNYASSNSHSYFGSRLSFS